MLRMTLRRNKPMLYVFVRFAKFACSHRRASWRSTQLSETEPSLPIVLDHGISTLILYQCSNIRIGVATGSDNHDLNGPLKKGDFDDPAAPHLPCRSYCSTSDRPSVSCICSTNQSH